LKARRRVSAVVTMTLGMVLLAGPAIADPVTETFCKNGGKADIDVHGITAAKSIESPQVGLLNLTNSLNNALSNSFNLVNIRDSFRIEDVKLIENFNLLTSASANTSCR